MPLRALTICRSASRPPVNNCKNSSEHHFRLSPEGETNDPFSKLCTCRSPQYLRSPGGFEWRLRRRRASEELDTAGDKDPCAETYRRDHGDRPRIGEGIFPC